MIKYFEFMSQDHRGNYIHSIEKDNAGFMMKTASNNYSPEIMEAIVALKRDPQYYYVVINALGSYEIWGANRNGDAFPRAALSHYSLRTDMGTKEDYGYKTFEYYAHLYTHHVNKDPNKGFGKVFFSSWNPRIERVELIVGIDKLRGADMIEAIEHDNLLAVSMGCFTNPEYPIMIKGKGYTPIKDIVVGDLVWTHKGNWKKVKELNRRKYTGYLYNVEFKGLPLPMEITANHPLMGKWFQAETNQLRRPYETPKDFENKPFDWAHAEHIEPGDHVQYSYPKYESSDCCQIDNIDLALLMGFYLAEGSFVYNDGKPSIIQLACNMNDDLPRMVPEIVNRIFPNTTCKIRPHSVSDIGLSVDIFSVDLAGFMFRMMGKHSKSKFIPMEVFASSDEIKKAFISAWFSGDGWLDIKGAHISSANINMVLQGRDLLASIGVMSSIYKITHKAGVGFSSSNTTEYTLNISAMDSEFLSKYAIRKMSKIDDMLRDRVKVGNSAIRINADSTMSYSVKDVTSRYVTDVDVYNFEVEDDESYSAAGLVSHNCKLPFDVCSICNNKARTTKEYCTHLKFYMGKVVTEEQAIKWSIELGKKVLPGASVHAWNHNPRFFDISKVFIGADSTSFSLGKVASKEPIIHSAILGEVEGVTDEQIDKLALLGKSSSIEKVIDGDSMNTGDGKMIDKGKAAAIRKMLDESFRKTITEEEEIPNQTLDTIANNFDLKQIFSTMMGMGIHPHPREVQRIIIIKTGYPDVANLLDERRLCFDDNEVVEDPIEMDIGNNNFDPAIAKMLMPMMLKRSCFPDYLLPRMEKKAEQNSPNPPLTAVLGPAALLAGIASLYAGLRLKAMGASNAQMFDLFRNQAWIPKMLGTGLSYKIMILDKQRQMDKMYVPARSYENAFFPSGFTGPLTKTSSVGGSLALGALGATLALPAGYVLNAYHRKSMYETGRGMFPGSGASPITVAGLVGGGTAAASLLKDGFSKDLFKKVVTKAK